MEENENDPTVLNQVESPDSEYEVLHFPESDEESLLEDIDSGVVSENGCQPNIPFSTVHCSAGGFGRPDRRVFIPGVEIQIKIIDVERHTHNILNPNLYTLQLTHGEFEWTVKRRYKHFHHLHHQLHIFRTALRLPIPLRKHRERRKSLKPNMGRNNRKLPRFPKKHEALVTAEESNHRAEQLADYLRNVLRSPLYRNNKDTLEFLEISHLSFVNNLGPKLKEGFIKKRSGGHRFGTGCRFFCQMCRNWCTHWGTRWLILKDTYLSYVSARDGSVHCVLLMDQGLEIHSSIYYTGIKNGILISNLSRRLLVNCPSARNTREWMESIKAIMETTGKEFIEPNRFGSFAPVREDTEARWFVDASGYFDAVANALEFAKEEIFIADWMLSPEIYMKRPSIEGQKWRLDKILQRKAEEGVKIFVLLYKELELALGINSLYSKQRLVESHPNNIKVLRHPDHVTGGTLFWAHHEKLVIVDQTYAFLGGIDLCYGRWDNHEHRLTDLGGIIRRKGLQPVPNAPRTSSSPNATGFGSFTIYQLAHATHSITVTPLKPTINSTESPLQKSSGWKWGHRRNRSLDNEDILAVSAKKFSNLESAPPIQQSSNDCFIEKDEQLGNTKLWVGKDYTNFIVRDFVELDSPFEDLVDRTLTPRMPWHDIGVMVQGKAARDVARHFIQRWNFTKAEKARDHPSYPWLLPKSYSTLKQVQPIVREKMSRVTCQVLRSVSLWSSGIKHTEDSIHKAYIYAIETAKQFIYIENQFFITQAEGNKDVSNGIGEALYQRIIRAHREGTTFRVYVVLPLLPAFEGEIGTDRGTAIQAVTHWNYASICRGPDSLIERLRKEVDDPSEYISFYGLRSHTELNDSLVTELIYVHSKLMIVDDERAIIGSANINDRSMLGKRDSEMAVFLEDQSFKENYGTEFTSGKFVGKMRKRIFKEFLGVLNKNVNKIDVSDPVCEKFYKEVWMQTASENTSAFDKVFHCIPTDNVHSFFQLSEYQTRLPLAQSDKDIAREMLNSVQGYLVFFPLQFLCEEDLTPPAGTKEALLPTVLWT